MTGIQCSNNTSFGRRILPESARLACFISGLAMSVIDQKDGGRPIARRS